MRQCALKLIVEVCRLNHIDQRGAPFKQIIVNFILGLRNSIRDPLVKKINEICLQEGDKTKQFINESEMELSIATKHASLDGRRVKQPNQAAFPSIGTLPGITGDAPSVGNRPNIVLPHSEPLSEEQKNNLEPMIGLFGLDLITCF